MLIINERRVAGGIHVATSYSIAMVVYTTETSHDYTIHICHQQHVIRFYSNQCSVNLNDQIQCISFVMTPILEKNC